MMLRRRFSFSPLLLLLLLINNANGYDLFKSLSAVNSPELLVNRTREFLITGAANSKMSSTCAAHLSEYMQSLASFQMWALSMFDAGGKIPSGILEGNIMSLGNFDQCLRIEGNSSVGNVTGQYCLALIPPMFIVATCLPSSCSLEDITELYNVIIGIPVSVANCQTEENKIPEFDDAAIGAISFFGVILGFMVLSTIYDVVLHYSKKKPIHPVTTAFSVFTNGQQLFKINVQGQITCLHGLRSITLLWVILVHHYAPAKFYPYTNFFETRNMQTDAMYMFLHGSGPAVDTFLLMGGLVISYSFLRAQKKGVKFNIILHYVHRYLRLTPILAAVVLFQATLVQYMGDGPLYSGIANIGIEPCRRNWWPPLLYVQNFVNPEDPCILPSWYLSVDTQLFLLSPLFLLPMVRWPKITFAVCGVLIALMSLAGFLVIWIDEVYAIWNANAGDDLNLFVKHYYYMPHIRGPPWVFGLMLGYFLFEMETKKKQYTLNKFLVVVTWVASIALLVALVYGPYDFMSGNYDRTENAVYALFVRVAWSLSIIWIIFACSTGYGGIIDWILSLPVFEVISKLVYGAYLIHVTLLSIIVGSVRATDHFSNANMMLRYCGILIISLAAAVVLSLAFEFPFVIIEKSLLARFERKVDAKPKPTTVSLKNDEDEKLELKVEPLKSNEDEMPKPTTEALKSNEDETLELKVELLKDSEDQKSELKVEQNSEDRSKSD